MNIVKPLKPLNEEYKTGVNVLEIPEEKKWLLYFFLRREDLDINNTLKYLLLKSKSWKSQQKVCGCH